MKRELQNNKEESAEVPHKIKKRASEGRQPKDPDDKKKNKIITEK